MDIKEIRKKKKLLERAIKQSIEEFEAETDTSVDYVRLHKTELMGDRRHMVNGVTTELVL